MIDFGVKTMSFESLRLKGRVSTLLMIVFPIIVGITSVFLSLLRFTASTNPYLSIIFMIPNFGVYILFLLAMNGFAKYYDEPKIFKNSLYAFIVSNATGITFLILTHTFVTPILDQLTTYISSPGDVPPLSLILPLIQVAAFIWIAMAFVSILNGFFYRRAFYALAEKSGEQNFKQAGLFMFIGGILMIIFVGALLYFIGLLFAIIGFFSMKPKAPQSLSDKKTPTN